MILNNIRFIIKLIININIFILNYKAPTKSCYHCH